MNPYVQPYINSYDMNETRAYPFYGPFGFGFPGYGFGYGYGFRPWFRPWFGPWGRPFYGGFWY
ncbi:hypothetical protein PU629_17215 [Pullulanibacillus sp. KACC 23026]|uniref:hypothetical protein n=1 Tax=Pullulanibacillus sp. KACC 23026 TaxID=3028315 RepID=UPI0023B1F313|nr:hypothetical protein [Pullulanibacillus sp. KACC 23026]WEG15069.1 hypothetical protein PU629_17215 [Pullulanibacillus sp. KACC 23026]